MWCLGKLKLVESRRELVRRHAKSTRRFGVRNYSTAFGSISTEDKQLFKNIGCNCTIYNISKDSMLA